MRSAFLALGLAAAGLLFGHASANAQYVDERDTYAGPYGQRVETIPKPVGPRVYGYYRDKVELDRPQGPGGCGTYFYWDGERCADARNKR